MTTNAHHGVHGCYCEDCWVSRARIDVEPANPERPIDLVRRLRRLRVRFASEVTLRRVS
jgi:hypothetical protein